MILKLGITKTINMPVTALLVPDPLKPENKYKYKIFTRPINVGRIEGFEVITYACDENWTQQSIVATATKEGNQMQYHREIREGAHKLKRFIASESTDPELNEELE